MANSGEGSRTRLTGKERILLYLLEVSKLDTAVEVSPELTQEGVARGSSVDLKHLQQSIRPLIREGLVRERRAHVRGIRQRRKVYSLTDAGAVTAVRLRERVKSEVVRVKDSSGVRETTVFQLLDSMGGKVSIAKLIVEHLSKGTIDLSRIEEPSSPPYVVMMSDAPRLTQFVGRQKELRMIAADDGHHRIFVIRGVAGIGKTSLAAKVCEMERGKRNIFWHKVRSWDTSLTMFAVLADFLRALNRPGLESVVRRGEIHRAAEVLRSDLPGTRALLVFDDVHEASREASTFLGLLKEAVGESPDARLLLLTRRSVTFYDSRDKVLTRLLREIDLAGLAAEDIATLLEAGQASTRLVMASRRVGGHPLLMQLLQNVDLGEVQEALPMDVQRFIEEQIYAGMSKDEGTVMKTISLFRVPVPRNAILSNPATDEQAFRSLVGRLLIRPAGEDGFEVHDTVRDFFMNVTTPEERKELGPYVLDQLRLLTAKARNDSNFAGCVDYLSNALQLSTTPHEQSALWEELGESNAALGDPTASLIAFKMAAKRAGDPETAARLHRKTAQLHLDHGQFSLASQELEAAIEALGTSDSAERGWIHLVRSRHDEWTSVEKAQDHAVEALRIFERFQDRSGQAHAHLKLAQHKLWNGSLKGFEDLDLKYAVDSAKRLNDRELDVATRFVVAEAAGGDTTSGFHGMGNLETSLEQVTALEAIPGLLDDLRIARQFFQWRGGIKWLALGDALGAMEDLSEALRISRKTHDRFTAANALKGLAMVEYMSGGTGDARIDLEHLASEYIELGLSEDAANSFWQAAGCCLCERDFAGFYRTLTALDGLRGIPFHEAFLAGLHGLECVLRGDFDGSRESFERAMAISARRVAEGKIAPGSIEIAIVELYYAVALGVMGDHRESRVRLDRSVEMFRVMHNKGALAWAPRAATQMREALLVAQVEIASRTPSLPRQG